MLYQSKGKIPTEELRCLKYGPREASNTKWAIPM